MSERWRDRYDSWKLADPDDCEDDDGRDLDAEREAAAEERAERMREDQMFDRDGRDEW